MKEKLLPSFKKPPLVETVLGIQFDPLVELQSHHLGAYWTQLGKDWISAEDASPLAPQFERFGTDLPWQVPGGFKLQVSERPEMRIRIRKKDRSRMIQVQNGRFHYNWLRVGRKAYPRYSRIRPEFDREWRNFCRFLKRRELGEPLVNQWEITYVNHILKGTVWSDPSEWVSVFSTHVPMAGSLPTIGLSGLNCTWRYDIPGNLGRLHFEVQRGSLKEKRNSDALVVKLTARGPAGTGSGEEVMSLEEGLDLGREVIVSAFRNLTSEKAHGYWELKDV